MSDILFALLMCSMFLLGFIWSFIIYFHNLHWQVKDISRRLQNALRWADEMNRKNLQLQADAMFIKENIKSRGYPRVKPGTRRGRYGKRKKK